MKYDPTQLRVLRDNIDLYLTRANSEDMRIYEALEKSIAESVTSSMRPLVDEFGKHVDRLIEAQNKSQ
jgi:hypothetical protein